MHFRVRAPAGERWVLLVCVPAWRRWIDPAWVKWMTSEDAPKPKPQSHQWTMEANALNRVSRARGFKTAYVSKQRRQGPLIHPN